MARCLLKSAFNKMFCYAHRVYAVVWSQVCMVATGVVGDLCRALEKNILPYCQHIMGWLMANLEGASVNRQGTALYDWILVHGLSQAW